MNTFTIAKREFVSFFASPVAYTVAFLFILILGIIFAGNYFTAVNQGGGPQPVQWVLAPLVTLVLFFGGGITMRLLAEETRSGTMELILTAPLREWELVVGKWLASLGFFIVVLVLTGIFILILNANSTPPLDPAPVLVAYLGVTLMVGTFLAIGVFASSLFSNQISAFFISAAIGLALWIISFLADFLPAALTQFFEFLDISGRYYENFAVGVIRLGDVVYFLSLIAFFLFAATQVVASRRWR